MYERLGEATLKSGQRMEIGVVTAPDADWRDRIVDGAHRCHRRDGSNR